MAFSIHLLGGRDKELVKEIYENLKEALEAAQWLKEGDTIEEFIDDADRDLSNSGVAYAWGRLLGAAEMMDLTVLELLDAAEVL